MKILLMQLSLKNFKGIKELTVKFGNETNISGSNATGKTTINDAWRWLLFGKDSNDRTDFNIKTLNADNTPIHFLEHEVSATIIVDDVQVVLKKVLHEKWVKPRGTIEQVMQGHETIYFYNDVPMLQKEYQAKVDTICPEANFKILTDPLFFPGLPWAKQREMLFHIAGTLTDDEIASINPEFAKLMETIRLKNVTLIEYKKEIAAKRLKIKNELDAIPTRIDEATKGMPQVQDWAAITTEIEQLEGAIKSIEEGISNKAKEMQGEFAKYQEIQDKKNAKISRRSAIEFEVKTSRNNLVSDLALRQSGFNTDISRKNNDIYSLTSDNQSIAKRIASLIISLDALRDEWKSITASDIEITDDQMECPACKRAFDGSDLDTILHDLRANFLEDKAKKLAENVSKGKTISEEIKERSKLIDINISKIETLKAEILTITEKRDEPTQEIPSLEKLLSNNTEYVQLGKEIEETIIPEKAPAVDTELQDEIRKDYRAGIDLLKAKLNNKEVIARTNLRIEELKASQSKLSQEQADLEKTDFTIQNFDKARIDAVEDRINRMFRVVRFKMFDQQLNGGEVPTCVCTVNGVPFPDLNTAMKINAGLDIITTLSEHFNIIAPIIIDNRESINEIPKMNQQIINLVVTKDKSLKVA